MLDSLDFQAAWADRSKVKEVLPNTPPATQYMEANPSVSFLEIKNETEKLECEEVEADLSQLFQPSQPLPSKKRFNIQENGSYAPSENALPKGNEAILDLEDENIFTPLSFKEFGY